MDVRVTTDGVEPDQRLHHRRHPAGRRGARLAIHLQLAGRAGRDLALQRRSGQVRRRRRSPSSCRTARRSTWSRNNVHHLRPDRRRPEAARPDAGAGAEPSRPAGRDDVRARCRTRPRRVPPSPVRLPASTSSLSARCRATPSTSPIPTLHQHASTRSRWCNVTDPAALPLQNATNANPQAIGVNFSGGMASIAVATERRAGSDSHLHVLRPIAARDDAARHRRRLRLRQASIRRRAPRRSPR